MDCSAQRNRSSERNRIISQNQIKHIKFIVSLSNILSDFLSSSISDLIVSKRYNKNKYSSWIIDYFKTKNFITFFHFFCFYSKLRTRSNKGSLFSELKIFSIPLSPILLNLFETIQQFHFSYVILFPRSGFSYIIIYYEFNLLNTEYELAEVFRGTNSTRKCFQRYFINWILAVNQKKSNQFLLPDKITKKRRLMINNYPTNNSMSKRFWAF